MSWTPDYQFRASYVLWHLRSFTQMNFREFDAAHESVCGTKQTCRLPRRMSVVGEQPTCSGNAATSALDPGCVKTRMFKGQPARPGHCVAICDESQSRKCSICLRC